MPSFKQVKKKERKVITDKTQENRDECVKTAWNREFFDHGFELIVASKATGLKYVFEIITGRVSSMQIQKSNTERARGTLSINQSIVHCVTFQDWFYR